MMSSFLSTLNQRMLHTLHLLNIGVPAANEVLATGLGNLPARWVWTAKTVRFGSGSNLKRGLLPLGWPKLDP